MKRFQTRTKISEHFLTRFNIILLNKFQTWRQILRDSFIVFVLFFLSKSKRPITRWLRTNFFPSSSQRRIAFAETLITWVGALV